MSYYNYTSSGSQFSEIIRDGQTVTLFPTPTISEGPQLSPVSGARPDLGLYDRIPGDAAPDDYYRPGDPTVFLSFEGTEYDPAARVRETSNWDSLSIDEIAQRKLGERDVYTDFVTFQSVRSTTNNNFWIVLDRQRRNIIDGATSVLQDRTKDRTGGSDSALGDVGDNVKDWSTYWARDIRILLIRDSNGQLILSEVGEVEYGQAVKDKGLYDEAVGDAYVACTNDIEAKRAAGVRADLVAIDVTSAAYGWPDYYSGSVSAQIKIL